MIIRTSVPPKKVETVVKKQVEEVKALPKKKTNKKPAAPAPVIEEPVVVEEELKIEEDTDLSKWLKEQVIED